MTALKGAFKNEAQTCEFLCQFECCFIIEHMGVSYVEKRTVLLRGTGHLCTQRPHQNQVMNAACFLYKQLQA